MDYNKLKFFVTVAENQSLSKAAKVLQRTQAAISDQVRKLEEELNTKLFERIGKQIVLTPEGEQIFELGKEKLGDIDDQVDWVISKSKQVKGQIRIGFLQDYSTPFPFFTLLANFRKKYPNITFEVMAASSFKLEQMLLENKLDFGMLANFEQRTLFETIQISTAYHLLVTSREYLESKGPFPSMDAILDADLIDLDINFQSFRAWIKKNIESMIPALIRKIPAITVPNHLATKEVLEAGHGIGVVPEFLVEKQLKRGEIIRLLPQLKELTVWLDLAYKKARKLQLFEKIFFDYLKEHLS